MNLEDERVRVGVEGRRRQLTPCESPAHFRPKVESSSGGVGGGLICLSFKVDIGSYFGNDS